MSDVLLVGISGKKRSGKDTLADFLIEVIPEGMVVRKRAFADALKEELSWMIGREVYENPIPPRTSLAKAVDKIRKEMYAPETKERYRLILQWWGTDYRRRLFGEDYWLRKHREYCEHSEAQVIIAPDCRFLNEAQYIKENSGILIRIDRNNPSDDIHISETALDEYYNFDIEINNNNSMEDLRIAAAEIIQHRVLPKLWGMDAQKYYEEAEEK